MLRVVPYEAEHLDRLDLQEAQAYLQGCIAPELRKALECPYSYTGLDGDRVVCCAGLIPFWEGRAMAWAYLAQDVAPRNFVVLNKMVKRFLDACPFERVEAYVDENFENGHRWVKALGFELEAPKMRKFRDGGTCAMYARVRENG